MRSLLAEAMRAAPGVEHVALSVLEKRGTVRPVAASGALARHLDAIQATLREGPSVDVIDVSSPGVVRIEDAQCWRWPEFMPRAWAIGMTGAAAIGVCWQARPVGALTLYSTDRAGVPEQAIDHGQRFAIQAGGALVYACKAEQLEAGMLTRQVIGQALGILMERYRMDEGSAFNYLRRLSQNGNRQMRDLAVELVAAGPLPAHLPSEP